MESSMLNMKVLNRNGLLYPMLVIAAVSVIVFSVFGVATMTGLLPRAESMGSVHALNDTKAAARPVTGIARHPETAWGDCAMLESIVQVEVKGSGLGDIAGGVTGAPPGNLIRRAGTAE